MQLTSSALHCRQMTLPLLPLMLLAAMPWLSVQERQSASENVNATVGISGAAALQRQAANASGTKKATLRVSEPEDAEEEDETSGEDKKNEDDGEKQEDANDESEATNAGESPISEERGRDQLFNRSNWNKDISPKIEYTAKPEGLDYAVMKERLDKMHKRGESLYDYVSLTMDPAADESLKKSLETGKQAATLLTTIKEYSKDVNGYRKKLKKEHEILMGDVKQKLEGARAQTLIDHDRPASASRGLAGGTGGGGGDGGEDAGGDGGDYGDGGEDAYGDGGGYGDGDEGWGLLEKNSSTSMTSRAKRDHKGDNHRHVNASDEGAEDSSEQTLSKRPSATSFVQTRGDARPGPEDDENYGDGGWGDSYGDGEEEPDYFAKYGDSDGGEEVEEETSGGAGSGKEPAPLLYPDYLKTGKVFLDRAKKLHKNVTVKLDNLAHTAMGKSLKYGFALDGLRQGVRNLRNSTDDVYKEKIRETFHRQHETMEHDLEEHKDKLFDEQNTLEGGQEFPGAEEEEDHQGVIQGEIAEGENWRDAMNGAESEGEDEGEDEEESQSRPVSGSRSGSQTGSQQALGSTSGSRSGSQMASSRSGSGGLGSSRSFSGLLQLKDQRRSVSKESGIHRGGSMKRGIQRGGFLETASTAKVVSRHTALKNEEMPVVPYTHFKKFGSRVDKSAEKIDRTMHRLVMKIPDMEMKSQEYKHNNFELQHRLNELHEKVIPKFRKKMREDRADQVKKIDDEWGQLLKHQQHDEFFERSDDPKKEPVPKEEWKATYDLVSKGKFPELPFMSLHEGTFGGDPYDSLSTNHWNHAD